MDATTIIVAVVLVALCIVPMAIISYRSNKKANNIDNKENKE